MKIKRIMANTETSDLNKAKAFYGDILGLELLIDHGWFQTYGSDAKMTVQLSFGSEGGAGTSVPDLSIELMISKWHWSGSKRRRCLSSTDL